MPLASDMAYFLTGVIEDTNDRFMKLVEAANTSEEELAKREERDIDPTYSLLLDGIREIDARIAAINEQLEATFGPDTE